MANLIFIESGSDATGDMNFYDVAGGDNAPVTSTTVANTGLRAVRCQGSGSSFVTKNGVLADAGRRIQCYLRLTTLPVNSYVPLLLVAAGQSEVYSVRITSGGVVQLFANGIQVGGDGATLSVNTWYRLTLSYTVTSLTVNHAKLWIAGSNLVDVTNATLGATGSNNLSLGFVTSPGLTSSQFLYIDDVVVDDGSAVDDPGAMKVTVKRPAGNNVNNFDTAIGASPSNRWTNVNEVPASLTNGWKHAATTSVQENFTLEAAAAGDVDVSGVSSILGRSAWIYAKRGLADGHFIQLCAKKAAKDFATTIQIDNDGADTVAGNTLVLAIALDNDANNAGGLITVTDSAGNSYLTAVQKSGAGAAGSSVRTLIAYCQNAASVLANGHWTINYPLVKNKAFLVAEFAGISATPLDKVASSSDGTILPTSGATATTTQAEEIIVGAVGFRGPVGHWSAPAAGMTHVDVVATDNRDWNVGVELQYALQSSTAAQTAGGTLNTLEPTSTCVACFKSAGVTVGSPGVVDNGSVSAVTLTTSPAVYTVLTTSATYPSNAAGIGMRSSNKTSDTFLYECGCLLAYVP